MHTTSKLSIIAAAASLLAALPVFGEGSTTVTFGDPVVSSDLTSISVRQPYELTGDGEITRVSLSIGNAEDSLSPSDVTPVFANGVVSFELTDLPNYTPYYWQLKFTIDDEGVETEQVTEVGMTRTHRLATLKPGSTTFGADTSWDIGVVPNDEYTDVLIDGSPSIASIVDFAIPANSSYTNGATTIDVGDLIAIKRTGSNQTSHNWYMDCLVNRGTFNVDFSASKNNQSLWAHLTRGGFVNEGSMNITGSGYESCTCGFEAFLNGSTNFGSIVVSQSSGGKKKDHSRLALRGAGTFVNNGTVSVSVSGSGSSSGECSATMELGGEALLDGTGKIVIDNSKRTSTYMNAYLKGAGLNVTVTNGTNHTIECCGIIDSLKLYNEGLFAAVGEEQEAYLRIPEYNYVKDSKSSIGAVTNALSGRIVGVGAAGLWIGSSGKSAYNTRFINLGLLESRTGSHIRFADGVNSTSLSTSTSATLGIGDANLELWGRVAGGGTFMHARKIVIADGAVLAPGDLANTLAEDGETVIYGTGDSTCGTLTFTNSLTMSSGTVSEFQFQKKDKFDTLHVGGTLKVDGTLKIVGKPHGGTFRMITSDNPITSDNEKFFAAIDLSAAEGGSKPRLKYVEDEQNGIYYIEASFGDGFSIIIR